MEKKPRHFTLMIMPESSSAEVRRHRISLRLIQSVVGVVVLVFVFAIAATAQSVRLWGQVDENDALRSQNEALRDALSKLDQKVARMDRSVERLGQFDRKLRALTMVSDPGRNLAIGPVGAPEEVAEGTLSFADEVRADLLAGRVAKVVELVNARAELTGGEAEATLEKVESLSELLEGQRAQLASTPSRRPARGYVTSTFGMRIDPFTGLAQRHAGIDFSAPIGAPVVATADGTVVYSGPKGAYGKVVEIDHGHGLLTKYAHMSEIEVRLGQKVHRGQPVGAVGNTGRSTGPHLHYEVRLNGLAVDPQRFLLE